MCEKTQRAALVVHSAAGSIDKIQPSKTSLCNTFISLKAYQMQKHCTVVYNTMRQDFTTHNDKHFIVV